MNRIPLPPSLLLAALLLGLLGCASALEGSYKDSYAPAPAAPEPEMDGRAMGQIQAQEARRVSLFDSLFNKRDQEKSRRSEGSAGKKAGAAPQQQSSRGKPEPAGGKALPGRPARPMVVYSGDLRLRVKRLVESVDRVTKLTQEIGGYVQSLSARTIIVRIPVARFDEAMKALAELGEVLDRKVKSLDVSAQFTDLSARLAVAREARDRLLALLEQTKDVEQRLAILKEIKRLSEQIESVESSLSTLKGLMAYSTITVQLVPILESRRTQVHRSPFSWVRQLEPQHATRRVDRGDVSLKLPKGFVLFDQEDDFRAQASDVTSLRVARVDNEPRGDSGFWLDALSFELEGRGYKRVNDSGPGRLRFRTFESPDLKPLYYLVAVRAEGEDLYLIETFYPSKESWDRHREAVQGALTTFRPKD